MKRKKRKVIEGIITFIIVIAAVVFTFAIFNIDPDSIHSDALQFIFALLQIGGFVVGLFFILFVLIIGSHAAISKDPIGKNLSEEMLKKRLKNSVTLIILILFVQYRLKKFRDWWHRKS